jgi:hypothetical protein
MKFSYTAATALAGAVMLMVATSALAASEDFKCLDGAKDPAPYKPGNVQRWCEIWRDGRLLYHGSVWRWYPSGQVQSKEWYVWGNAEGEWPSWYENGKMSSLGSFKNGTKVGTWKYWNESGQLATEVTYSDPLSSWKEYYSTGRTKATGATFASEKVGPWTYWRENGTEIASCDFGDGLFSLTTEACRVIAEQVEPKGYSRPIPKVSISEQGMAVVKVASDSYKLVIPKGWKADTEAAKKERVALALVPNEGKWRDSGPSMYVRVLPKEGRSFEATVGDEEKAFEENVADFIEGGETRAKLPDAGRVLTKFVTYKPTVATDSPFSIVAENTVHEQVSYVDVSADVVLIAVLACNSKADLDR